ncbi:MAG TPA: apolipoprotein N-acyltransferase [Nocardioidaceae bacterium]|nr:apolipoprotein N-acyltransferase [Nocardioidaceae bacterium]
MPAPSTLARVGLSAASGLAVAFGFPPYDFVFLIPLGIAGLMLVMRGQTGRAGFWHGLVFGLGFMLPLVRWVTIIGDDAWIALALLEALFYGLMGVGWAWLRPTRGWPWALAATWVAAEWLRSTVPFGGMPWGRLAFGLVDTPLVRYGRVGGTALVAFAVVAIVGLIVDVVERRRVRADANRPMIAALALAVVSLVLPVGAAHPIGTTQVAAVQGNVPGEGLDPFLERRVVLDNHSQATIDFAAQVDAGERPQPDLVIWPENSTDIDPYTDPSAYREIDDAVKAIGVPTLVGAIVDGPGDHIRNMGIVWDPQTGPGEQYVKRHPVPFGEYIPFRGLLTKFIGRLSMIPHDMYRGTTDGVLQVGPVLLGDVICFEVAYDGLVRNVIDDGGQMLVVQTNNATYTGTGQLEQQFAISRYRAIETGRTVVVAATNGISGIISPDGSVLVQTDQKTREVLDEQVTLADGVTLGVRLGFWVELLITLAAIALLTLAYLGRRRSLGTLVR